jgi:hypothetical protein
MDYYLKVFLKRVVYMCVYTFFLSESKGKQRKINYFFYLEIDCSKTDLL